MKTVYVQVFHSSDSLDTDVYLLKYEINHGWFHWDFFTSNFVLTGTRNTLMQGPKNGRKPYLFPQKKFVSMFYAINIFIPVNLSDPHGRRSPAIQNEKAGDFARRLFWAKNFGKREKQTYDTNFIVHIHLVLQFALICWYSFHSWF